MKKLALLILAAVLCIGAVAPSDSRTVLASTTTNGVTKTLYVGRVQSDPAKDGSATLTVYPDVVLSDSAGNVLSAQFGTPFNVTLTPQQYAAIAGIITQAYAAQNP